MPQQLRHGIPHHPGVAATGLPVPGATARVTVVHDLPLVPVRGILAAALASDTSDRDIVWVTFDSDVTGGPAAVQARACELIRATLADAFGLTLPGDARAAVTHTLGHLERPLLLAVDLHAGVPRGVDTGLLQLLSSSPLLSIVAVCEGRRAFEGRGRLDYAATIVAPSMFTLTAHDIQDAAGRAGITLTDPIAASLAHTAIAQADVLPAVLSMMSPDAEIGDEPDTNAIRMLAETSYVLELRAQAMSDAELRTAAALAVPTDFSASMVAGLAPGAAPDNRALDRLVLAKVLFHDGRFRMEQTVRRAVLDEAASRMPLELAQLHIALGHHLRLSQNRFGALTQFAEAKDWNALIALIDVELVNLIAEDSVLLHRVILDLPRSVRDENPRLSLYLECDWRQSDAQSLPYLSLSRKMPAALSRMPDVMSPWDRLTMLLARSLVQRLKGDFTGAVTTAAELEELLADDEMIDRPILVLAEAHYQSGMSRLLGLDLVGARESFQASAELAQGSDTSVYRSSARATELLALTRALEGEAQQASTLLLSLDSDRIGTAGLVAHALVATSRLDPKGARHWLAQLADMRSGDEFWAFAVHASNRYGLYWGDPVETDADLDRAWAEHGDQLSIGSTAQVLLTSDAADLALLLGQLPRAEAALDQCTVRNTWILVCRARLALHAGNPKHALLFILEGQGRGRMERHGQLDLAVLRAATEHALNRDEDAAASLLRAIKQSNKSGVIVPFHLLPLETLSELGALHSDAEDFITHHQLRGTSYLAPYQALAGALSERELVVLRALEPGATIEQVARKLFVASNTVKAQLRSIYRKLNVSSRTEALLVATELGLLDQDSRTA